MDTTALVTDLINNAVIWVPVLVTVLSSVVTGLTNYPKASGFVAALQKVLGVLSFVQHIDSPQSVAAVKFPLHPAEPPAKV